MSKRKVIEATVDDELCIVHPTIVENADGTLSFEARVTVNLSDGGRRWTADKVLRFRAQREEAM